MAATRSINFGFLQTHDSPLADFGALSEHDCRTDPVVCLIRLRQLGELLAEHKIFKGKLDHVLADLDDATI